MKLVAFVLAISATAIAELPAFGQDEPAPPAPPSGEAPPPEEEAQPKPEPEPEPREGPEFYALKKRVGELEEENETLRDDLELLREDLSFTEEQVESLMPLK